MGYHKQKEKITFKIIPHTSRDTFNLQISKKWIKFIAILVLISMLTLGGSLYYYYKQYNILLPYKEKSRELKEENKYLDQKLSQLSTETKEVKEQFKEIKEENRKIKEMVDFNNQASSRQSSNLLQPNNNRYSSYTTQLTGGYYNSKEERIYRTEANLNLLKEELPEKERDLSQLEEDVLRYKDYLASKPEGWPVKGREGRIASTFGYRIHPILKKRMFHEGIDIGVWYNNKVIATGRGKVVYAGWKHGYGRVVIIDHGFNYRTLYAHNNRLLVRVGQKVERGEAIALSGNSGRSTGPHVHYEVQYKGRPVDPMDYLK